MELSLFKILLGGGKKDKKKIVKIIDQPEQTSVLHKIVSDHLKEQYAKRPRTLDDFTNFYITRMVIYSDSSIKCSIRSESKPTTLEVDISAAEMLAAQFEKKN